MTGAVHQVRARKLQIVVALCSIVFTIGTALHNFAIVDTRLIETMMRMEGGADPTGDAPGFTTGFRLVGCVYILGNALGVRTFWFRSRTVWWTVFAVNATQALGFVMIPSSMWTAVADRYGVAGLLPSAVTDGGGLLLALAMIAVMVRFRAPWGLRRVGV
jgi:hypothetical protein